MPNPAAALALSQDQELALKGLVRNGNTPQKVALRCRLVLVRRQKTAMFGISNSRFRGVRPVSGRYGMLKG